MELRLELSCSGNQRVEVQKEKTEVITQDAKGLDISEGKDWTR